MGKESQFFVLLLLILLWISRNAATGKARKAIDAVTPKVPSNGGDTEKAEADTSPVPQGPDYILDCCKNVGVLSECISVCTEVIDMRVYAKNPSCLDEFPKLLPCATNGVDQSSCCKTHDVPAECLQQCNGRLFLGEGSGKHMGPAKCANYTSQILSCHEDGHKLIPGTPVKVGVKITSQHEANVTWGAPTWNGETVTTYVVYYKKHGENNYTTVRTKDTWARLTDLEKGSEYNITVLAKNKHGFSAFTPLISKKIVPDEAPKTNGKAASATRTPAPSGPTTAAAPPAIPYATEATLTGEPAGTGIPATQNGSCQASLSFEIISAAPEDRSINFTEQFAVGSAKQCANICFVQRCVQAGYIPSVDGGVGTCLLTSQGSVHCNRWGSDRVSDYTGGNITHIQCVRCEPGVPTTAAPGSSLGTSAVTTSPPAETTFGETPRPTTARALRKLSSKGTTAAETQTSEQPTIKETTATPGKSTTPPAETTVGETSASTTARSARKLSSKGTTATPRVTSVETQMSERPAKETAATPGKSSAAPAPTPTTAAPQFATGPPIVNSCSETVAFEVHEPAPDLDSFSDFAFVIDAKSASECARLCYERKCSLAGFTPPSPELELTRGHCFMAFGLDGSDRCASANRTSTFETVDAVTISCVKCGVESQGENLYRSAGQGASTEPAVNAPTEPGASCDGELLFEATQAHFRKAPPGVNFTFVQVVKSVEECAALCYSRRCQVAGYTPPITAVSPLCLLSDTGGSTCGKNPGVREANNSAVNEIRCVRCKELVAKPDLAMVAANGTVPLKKATGVVEKHESRKGSPNGTVVGESAVSAVAGSGPFDTSPKPPDHQAKPAKDCAGALTFEAVFPEASISKLLNFTEKVPIKSALECVKECYVRSCLIAGYSPAAFGSGPLCHLAYSGDSVCGKSPRIRQLEDNGATIVEIHCVECVHGV